MQVILKHIYLPVRLQLQFRIIIWIWSYRYVNMVQINLHCFKLNDIGQSEVMQISAHDFV